MKWQTLSLALFASASIASPIAALSKNDIYTLRVSSKYAKEIDGSTLTLKNNQIGVFRDAPAVQFYTVPSAERPGRVELHKYPVSDSDQVLAFVGKQGLLDFSVTNPSTVPTGTTCDWKSFSLVSKPQNAGKPENLVTYASGNGGSWVAFKTGHDDWTINWRGADAVTIEKRSYMIVDVVYEPVGTEGSSTVVGSS
ncbi:hypothetical protein BR93DRAFT_287320 [Coniochaeta sp. PMI_546]|nr:hypothetical protein BR93DRAFT_287320 [Coniochaeta sp. PMI_546]